MGYETTASGDLRFDEPLIFKAFRNSPWRRANDPGRKHDVRLIEDSRTEDTATGQATVITAVGIEAAWETGKHYELETDLQALLDSLPTRPEITGYLELAGEWPDARRIYVRDMRVATVHPTVVWQLGGLDLPDETVKTRWDNQ